MGEMTGQDHYREAERLLDNGGSVGRAQVHATLALAAMFERIAYPPKVYSAMAGGAEVTDEPLRWRP